MPVFRMRHPVSGTGTPGRSCSSISMRCCVSRALPRERPFHVLAHHERSIGTALFEYADDLGRGGGIAECDRDVARPAHEPQAMNRGASRALIELLRRPAKELRE